MKKKLYSITPAKFFLFGLILLVLLMFVPRLTGNSMNLTSLLHYYADKDNSFMDFFTSIYDAGFDNPYVERGVIYPPLTYLFYRFCGLFLCSREYADAMVQGMEQYPTGAFYWRSSTDGLILILALTAISVYLLYRVFVRGQKENKTYCITVFCVLFASVPFWYLYERGNLTLQSLLFLAFYVTNYRSENQIRRELALISLAVSVSFKIYPVLFGVLLLMDKQYKAAFRCVIYGVLLFFLPFLAFGGMGSLPVMLSNIMSTSDVMKTQGFGYKINIDNTLVFLADPFSISLSPVFSAAVKILLILCMVLVLLQTKKDWQRYMVLSAVMIIFPRFSYTYTLVFVSIPLFAFLQERPETTQRSLLFSLLFLGMFAPFLFGRAELYPHAPRVLYPLNLTTVISSLSLVGMLLLMTADTLGCLLAAKKGTAPCRDASAAKSLCSVFLILLVLTGGLYWGYRVSSDAYNRIILIPGDSASELDTVLSDHIQTDDQIMYFSYKPFFDQESLRKYGELYWCQITDQPTYDSERILRKHMEELLALSQEALPSAIVYSVYPAFLPENAEKIPDRSETAEAWLRQFAQENGYTLEETVPVEEEYDLLVYIKTN